MDLQPLKKRDSIVHALASTETLDVKVGDVLWATRDDGGGVIGEGDDFAPNYIAGAGTRLPLDYYNGTEPRPVLSLDKYAEVGAIGFDSLRPIDVAYDGVVASVRLRIGGDPAREYPTAADPSALPPIEGLPRPRPLRPIIWDTGVSVVSNAPVSGSVRVQTNHRDARIEVSSGVAILPQTRPDATESVPNPPYDFNLTWARHVTVIYIDAFAPGHCRDNPLHIRGE